MITAEQFTEEHRAKVCKIGQRNACCRYLTMGPNGWGCEKHTSLKATLDRRVVMELMVARGDNCAGLEVTE